MALSWDTTKIDDKKVWHEVSQETLDKEAEQKKKNPNRVYLYMRTRRIENGKTYQMKAEVNTLIFLSMNIGISEITEKNYEKFYNRLHLLENTIERADDLKGAYMTITAKVERPLTKAGKPDKRHKEKEIIRPYQFTKEMIKDLIGLKTNCTPLNKTQFLKNALRMKL